MDKLQAAVVFAVERHAGQWRDGEHPLPYASHVVEVMALLRNVGGVTDEDALSAAVLHDTLEDTQTTEAELQERFGERVAHLVKGMTRNEPDDEQRRGLRKAELAELRDAMLLEDIRQMDPDVWPIKLADRLSNLRGSLRTKKGKKLDRYLKHTTAILEIIPKSANPGLWKQIKRELKG